MSGELILIVDDEPNIVQLARLYLERENFRVEAASDGLTGLQKAEQLRPALLLLDLMLPELDGMEVCRRLRAENNPVPIFMITARDEDIDKILGLELGADDYLTKPFNPREMVARVKAILRRGDRPGATTQGSYHLNDLVIDPARREVTVKGSPISLRHQEFNLLLVFVQHKGLVLTREQLLDLAWGYDNYVNTRTVDVHVGQLRKKLAGSQVRIDTVTSDGYKLSI